ncbi:hypothetical protein LNP26_14785 [Klebsiella variicola subsp. variicola]|nr:hypothetical protein [Klebsiella variicola subsp. variicola]
MFDAVITEAGKKNVTVEVLSGEPDDRESPLHIHLGQVMSRGEKWNLLSRNRSNSG